MIHVAPVLSSPKITRVETITNPAYPNVLWVRLHSADGRVGLGETYYQPQAVEAVVHSLVADFVLGMSPFDTERLWDEVFSWTSFSGPAGAEIRALSAVDIAMWDLIGQTLGQPIYNLLGGRTRDRIRIYNTCVNAGPHLDQDGFIADAGALASDLLERGITAMKIWPWDRFAPQLVGGTPMGPAGWSAVGPSGHDLTAGDLDAGLDCVRSIRAAVGTRVDIMIEGHSRWDLNAAIRIAQALEPYDVLWMEDMIKTDSPADLLRLSRESRVPHCISERLITRYAYREILELGAARVVMPDLVWTGGLTEGKKIAVLADTYHLPIAPHDCTGLVALFANVHLSIASPNAMILETVRGFYEGWYRDVYTDGLVIRDGHAEPPSGVGLGTRLSDAFLADESTEFRRTTAS